MKTRFLGAPHGLPVSGRWSAAIAGLREYLSLQPNDGKIWTSLAACCEKVRDEAGRLEALRNAAEVFERERLLPQAAALAVRLEQSKLGWAIER